MRRYGVRILRRAESDLLELAAYVQQDSPAAASRLLAGLLDAIADLQTLPARGVVPRERRLATLGYRFIVYSRYLVFYKVLKRQVRVYRVRHAKRLYLDLL